MSGDTHLLSQRVTQIGDTKRHSTIKRPALGIKDHMSDIWCFEKRRASKRMHQIYTLILLAITYTPADI